MIRLIDIRLNAAHPELPLAEAVTYTGAPSTMLIRGVPGNCGKWCITSVYVAATFPDGSTSTRLAVQSANGVWVATLPATATSGRTASGVRIMADGEDENGEIVTGYILGVADFAVASLGVTPAPEPGATSWQMLYFDTVPGVLRKGDVTKIDGVLKLYNGTAWEPFADLSGYVPTSRTINGKALTDNVSLSGADIPVDATPGAQNINAALADKLDKSGGIADDLLICGANEAIKFDDSFLYMYRKINGAWVAQNVWDLRTSQDGIVAFLSDIYDAVQQIAPVFTAKTYAANDLCTYNGVVYRCKMGYTATASSAKPGADATHWEAKPVSELFLPLTGGTMTGPFKYDTGGVAFKFAYSGGDWQYYIEQTMLGGTAKRIWLPSYDKTGTLALTAPSPTTGNLAALDAQGNPTDSQIPKANVALKSELRYSLINPTVTTGTDDTDPQNPITYGAVTLVDRAALFIHIDSNLDELRITLPASVASKVRDCGLTVNVAEGVTPPAITITGNPLIGNPDGTMPELTEAINLLYFSEIGPYGMFLVKGEQLQQITQ